MRVAFRCRKRFGELDEAEVIPFDVRSNHFARDATDLKRMVDIVLLQRYFLSVLGIDKLLYLVILRTLFPIRAAHCTSNWR